MWIDIDSDTLIKEIKKTYDVEEIYSDADIIYYVTHTFEPDEVFTENELAQWALANGFTLEE